MNSTIVKEECSGATLRQIIIKPGPNRNEVSSFPRRNEQIYSFLKEVFLPQGYPASVSDDYMQYQIWDTLQELCSSLNGTLASHAIFIGIGVGNSEATALGATYTWLLKDGAAMLSNILFAWSKGTLLDIDAKCWRLFADVMNDVAMFVDLLSPLAPPYMFSGLMCITTVFRSLVGVAGGCTRATIKQHQAQFNNTADVSAKDGSQANMSNLLGLLLSMTVINLVATSPLLTWITFSTLTFLHIYCNYRACTCLVMKSLNPTRYSLLIDKWLADGVVLTPDHVNRIEPFILGQRSKHKVIMGASLKDLQVSDDKRLQIALNSNYVIYFFQGSIKICLKSGSSHGDLLEAFYCAKLASFSDCHIFTPSTEELRKFSEFRTKLENIGWDLSLASLGASEIRFTLAQ